MLITDQQLARIMPLAGKRVEKFILYLNAAMEEFGILTDKRKAAFLAMLAVESGDLRYVEEIASGAAYEGRTDLGNTRHGDGTKFKGHGLIQITGRFNHEKCAEYFGKTVEEVTRWLVTPEGACRSAGWFWETHGLNEVADAGDFRKVTKIVNGGYNHYDERLAYYRRALDILTLETQPPAPVEERSTQAKEKDMIPLLAPFLKIAVPSLISSIPEFAKIFSSPDVAERNTAAVVKASELIMASVDAPNIQTALEKIESSPQAAEAANSALRMNRAELIDMMERLNAMDQKNIASAREFSKGEQPIIGNLKFVHILSLLFVLFSGIGSIIVLNADKFSQELKGAIVTLILIGGWTGVKEFWLGSSSSSQMKDEIKRTERQ